MNATKAGERALGVAVFVVVAALAVNFVRLNRDFAIDDSFITFRYAQHFADGFGLTFNVGERYYGTTAAGYALLLAVLFRLLSPLGASIPHVSIALSAVGLGLVVLQAARAFATQVTTAWLRALMTVVFAACVFMNPAASEVAGHETCWFVGLVALGVMWTFQDHLRAGLLVLSVAAMMRPDAGLVAGIAWLLSLLLQRAAWKRHLHAAALFVGSQAAWLGGLWWYFGTPLPRTLEAKQAQVTTGLWSLYTWNQVQSSLSLFGSEASWWLVVLAVCLAVVTARAAWGGPEKREQRVLAEAWTWVLWAAGSVVVYLNLRVTIWPWYVLPLSIALFSASWFVGALSFRWSGASLQRERAGRMGALFVRVGLLLVGAAAAWQAVGWRDFALGSPRVNPHVTAYQPIIDVLRREAPDGATVAMPEPGSFAFHLGPKYRVIDLLGLITPGVARAYAQGDRAYVVRTFAPDYLVRSWSGPFNPDVADDYELCAEFETEFWRGATRSPLKLFRRK